MAGTFSLSEPTIDPPNTCKKSGSTTLLDREADHSALGFVATPEGGEEKCVETMAVGTDAMGKM